MASRRKRCQIVRVGLLAGVWFGCLYPAPLISQNIANGGFENGDFSTCWIGGGFGLVEVLQANHFSPPINPPEGNFFALLSTGPLGSGPPSGDFDNNGRNDFNASTLRATFVVTNAPQMLCFDWAFLTSEVGQNLIFDDIFEVTLNGVQILTGSIRFPGGVSPFPDTAPYNGVATTVNSPGPTDGSDFESGRTGFSTFCTNIAANGTYTLQFLIADQSDNLFDSGLLIDRVQVMGDCINPFINQITDSSGSNLEVKTGGFTFEIQSNDSVASSDNGRVLSFVSNGDYAGDNPNLRPQIFTFENGVFQRITAVVDGHVGHPALTSNGRWLTFESAGDPLGSNADANIEIFRYDRNNGNLVQVTNTSGCNNTHPSISHDGQGRRISFLSNCNELNPGDGFNPDGNPEVVIWDANTGNYFWNGTSGCTNQGPEISQHNGGRYVSFISDCNYDGGNADGNLEVFQWDRQSNNYEQITASSAGSGHFNDVVSSSFNGRYVAFLSNANFTGQNPGNNLVVFRYDRNPQNFTQITPSNPGFIYTNVDIDDSGDHLGLERIDLNTFELQILHYDVNSGNLRLLAEGNSSFPAVGVDGGTPKVAFQSDGNFSGNNGDGNLEVWSASVQ